MTDHELSIVEMSLSGYSTMEIVGIRDLSYATVEDALFKWDDLTDDEHDLYLARMDFAF
jgi:hypothetical protein